MTGDIRAFQIYYDGGTRAALDPEFEPLDNSGGERRDWYEYWPIRKYLLERPLDESAWYGFLSPRFRDKTHLAGRRVKEFVQSAGDADVVTFSPHPCFASCFVNVFEQADFFGRGLYQDAARFFERVDPNIRLDWLVMDSRNTVFCNYFFAKPRFWRAWLDVFSLMLEQTESAASALHGPLNREMPYQNDDGTTRPVASKIFVMERTVSFLLAGSREYPVRNFPPFEFPVMRPFAGRVGELMKLDELKIAYSKTGDPRYLETFIRDRDRMIESVWPAAPPRLFSRGAYDGRA
jgi:hypothetical protein